MNSVKASLTEVTEVEYGEYTVSLSSSNVKKLDELCHYCEPELQMIQETTDFLLQSCDMGGIEDKDALKFMKYMLNLRCYVEYVRDLDMVKKEKKGGAQ